MPLPGASFREAFVKKGSRGGISLLNAIKRTSSRLSAGPTEDSVTGSSASVGQSSKGDSLRDQTSRTSSENVYVEPPSPPPPPAGGLIEAATEKVQTVMTCDFDLVASHAVSDDQALECKFYMTKTCNIVDRVVVFIGDDTGAPAGLWSRKLCKRSGRQGGGIHQGSLGSMLPYLQKCKEEKMGILMVETQQKGSIETLVDRFDLVWKKQVSPSKATHVFIVAYSDGGKIVMETLRQYYLDMKRQLSGVAFIDSTHGSLSDDPYALQKLVAQWAVAWVPSQEELATRLKPLEDKIGCITFSSGCEEDDQIELLRVIVPAVFAAFKARWSGFRVAQRSTGTERACYTCQRMFTLRRWRHHCRTCQNAVCERCSSTEPTRQEGQVRLCLTCKSLPSLVHWSRPRAVRTGDKESVYSDSTLPGKMGVDDFELMHVIGRGACGKVLLVQKKQGPDAGALYAMKVLKKQWVLNKSLVTQTMAERRILQQANHPFIVQLRYAFQNQDKLYMVMDYYHGGSLRHVLRRRGRFSITRARFYLAEILLAIAHLHSKDIIYRDIKLENIVVTSDGHVACTDFGLSKEEMTDDDRTKSFVGTCEYLAPELIKKTGYGRQVDWWAFGILTFEMIQGDSPFKDKVPLQLFEKIVKEKPVFTERFTDEAKDLVSKLLDKNPKTRLGCGPNGAEDIKNHPFFENVDWDTVMNKTFEMPPPPHRPKDVADECFIGRAVMKARESREELMADSPVAPKPNSSPKHFDRFSYAGIEDWDDSTPRNNPREDRIDEDDEDDE